MHKNPLSILIAVAVLGVALGQAPAVAASLNKKGAGGAGGVDTDDLVRRVERDLDRLTRGLESDLRRIERPRRSTTAAGTSASQPAGR